MQKSLNKTMHVNVNTERPTSIYCGYLLSRLLLALVTCFHFMGLCLSTASVLRYINIGIAESSLLKPFSKWAIYFFPSIMIYSSTSTAPGNLTINELDVPNLFRRQTGGSDNVSLVTPKQCASQLAQYSQPFLFTKHCSRLKISL